MRDKDYLKGRWPFDFCLIWTKCCINQVTHFRQCNDVLGVGGITLVHFTIHCNWVDPSPVFHRRASVNIPCFCPHLKGGAGFTKKSLHVMFYPASPCFGLLPFCSGLKKGLNDVSVLTPIYHTCFVLHWSSNALPTSHHTFSCSTSNFTPSLLNCQDLNRNLR